MNPSLLNQTTLQWQADSPGVMLGYNESSTEIALIPLPVDLDRPDVFKLQDGSPPSISARSFLKDYGIDVDQTIRYSPEWDEDLGQDQIDGGFRIDLSQHS